MENNDTNLLFLRLISNEIVLVSAILAFLVRNLLRPEHFRFLFGNNSGNERTRYKIENSGDYTKHFQVILSIKI